MGERQELESIVERLIYGPDEVLDQLESPNLVEKIGRVIATQFRQRILRQDPPATQFERAVPTEADLVFIQEVYSRYQDLLNRYSRGESKKDIWAVPMGYGGESLVDVTLSRSKYSPGESLFFMLEDFSDPQEFRGVEFNLYSDQFPDVNRKGTTGLSFSAEPFTIELPPYSPILDMQSILDFAPFFERVLQQFAKIDQ